MVILIIDENCIFTLKCECDTPIASDLNGPMPNQIAVERMKTPAWRNHIRSGLGAIKSE